MKDEEHCFCVSCSNFEQLRHAVLNTFCDHDDADQYGEHIANTTNSLDAARDAVRASPSHVFVPPPPDILFCTTPCHCVTCDGLSTAYQQAMGCWFELPGNVGALSDRLQHACEQIDDVARLLQRQHKPEIYDSSPTALQTLKEKPTTQRESYLTPQDSASNTATDFETYGDKFMVCEHCMAHALPCNEAAICDQCMMHGIACVHRWCRDSPLFKDRCSNPHCRLVHADHMPTISGGPEYIVFSGKLPPYRSYGRAVRWVWDEEALADYVDAGNSLLLDERYLETQATWAASFEDQVASGIRTYESVRATCTDACLLAE